MKTAPARGAPGRGISNEGKHNRNLFACSRAQLQESSTPSGRRFRHDGDGADPEQGRQRGGCFRSIGTVLAPVLARCGVPDTPPPDSPPASAPPPGALDPIAAARLLGACIARDDIGPLRQMLAAAPPAEVSAFLARLARGDVELGAAETAARWRVTGSAADLDAAIAAALAVWPGWANTPAPDGEFQE